MLAKSSVLFRQLAMNDKSGSASANGRIFCLYVLWSLKRSLNVSLASVWNACISSNGPSR